VSEAEEAVLLAAQGWWEHRRPSFWSEDAHLRSPDFSLLVNRDRELAHAIARMVSERRKAAARKVIDVKDSQA
jgi:hypothetical protein